ncbi:hypothetical protein [Henriciella aquimarina]|uniref:hypothetical protein n=1 Tax=Henriciella aquimarina TaxID=545261 RepID=UPI001301F27E|nr:hypothetical protein [Henriciella aquimarina]
MKLPAQPARHAMHLSAPAFFAHALNLTVPLLYAVIFTTPVLGMIAAIEPAL